MRLATWNVLHGAPDHVSPADPARLAATVAALDADVLALQEVDRDQPRSGSVDQVQAVRAGYLEARFCPALLGTPGAAWRPAGEPDPGGTAYGIGLLTRAPVRAWHVLRLPAAPAGLPVRAGGRLQVFRDEPRVALAAELDGLTVVATHLSFVPGWNALHLRRVCRWAERLPGPRVLLGDLNAGPRLTRLASGWTALAAGRTFPADHPRRQIDHVLGHGALPPVRRVEVPEVGLSDHRPLVVELG